MRIVNETDHEAKLVRIIRDEHTAVGIVAIKSTYDIGSGRPSLSRRQRRVLMRPETEDGVDFEPEGVLGKVGVDLLVVGAAAGDGRTQMTTVSMRIGSWSSYAIVHGDRSWKRSMLRWGSTNARPFSEMPVSWSTAFGGVARQNDTPIPHDANPRGKGYIIDTDGIDGTPLPNIEDPEDLLEYPGQRVRPFGFAPLPCSSALRIESALDDSTIAGVNLAIYNVAPPQHRVSELRGGERCELRGWVGATSEVFELPVESFVVELAIENRSYEVWPRLDTVCVFTTQRQLVLTQRATFVYRYARGAARVARVRHTGKLAATLKE